MTHRFPVLVMFAFCAFASAGSGKAVMPSWYADASANTVTNMFITNITDNPVDVTVSVYKKDGTLLTTGVTLSNFTGSQLDADNTGIVTISSSTAEFGYVVIEWVNQSGDDDIVALISIGLYDKQIPFIAHARSLVAVNEGMPF